MTITPNTPNVPALTAAHRVMTIDPIGDVTKSSRSYLIKTTIATMEQ